MCIFQMIMINLLQKFFDGAIDELKIYNYVFSPAQIGEDYNAGFGTYFK